MKTAILWDLDGTLLDTLEDLMDGVNYAMDHFGYPRWTLADIRRFVGNGARNLLTRACPEGADIDAALAAFHEYYDVHCQDKTGPYAGIPEVLARLTEKYPMAIVSNKPDVAVKPLCDLHFPGLYARGEIAGCPRKPAPDMVYAAMEAIGADRCIYVGDSEVDIATAKNAGAPCLTVLWGFRDRDVLEAAGATHFCKTVQELEAAIEELICAGGTHGE